MNPTMPLSPPRLRDYLLASTGVGAIAAIGAPLLGAFDLANIAMLFPLVVMFNAVRFGRGPAVLSAFLSVALFDFFFVHPHFTFAVSDLQYLLTFSVLLAVALTTAELAARLRHQRDMAAHGEHQAQRLYQTARALSAAASTQQIDEIRRRTLATLMDEADDARPDTLRDTYFTLFATANERVRYLADAERSRVEAEAERLRSAVLATLSHDLRTPLTALAGLAESLPLAGPPLPARQAEIADAIRTEALRTHALARDLLDLARLQSGSITLRRAWLPVEEVVGAALQASAGQLSGHRLDVGLPEDLPMVELDPVLMERVLCNLLDNAARHTPAGGLIALSASATSTELKLVISDSGPGLPPEGRSPSGAGLGLSLVRSILAAHGGTLSADSPADGGARFTVHLPLTPAPTLPEDCS
ncbi:DUF4118 domain-containing protein [Azoarcus communis]|uniref:DUF4118 domain-containing protein n=1 Tax=Parazoarcus communis TaxID=41977 RepID=UPI0014598117|nr:DUF4118 domain-containing protein [Parazoarcus communis]NMG47866.1 DUF4118 domain-containing protein [Parazoarcus communis]